MTAPLIKICGVTDRAALDAAATAGATHVGFNFFARSPRFLGPDRAAALAAEAAPSLSRVALLVDPSDLEIDAAIAAIAPHVLQLHGRETPERIAAIKARTGVVTWKALPVAAHADLALAGRYRAADRLLFDAKPPADADRPGGHGATFDWSLLNGLALSQPWILSGGLHASNVAAAICATGAPGVDAASGVEAAPGLKDPEKIVAFVKAAVMAFARVLEPQP